MLLVQKLSIGMQRAQSSSPPLTLQSQRDCSPAISEISVGSPSPPPPPHPSTHFRPLNIKRLRLLRASPTQFTQQSATLSRRKCNGERVKSFSIADILGKHEETTSELSSATDEPSTSLLHTQLLNERLQNAQAKSSSFCSELSMQQLPPAWDPGRSVSHQLHPLLSPALLHSYEQRLAWDYQRQLQEHFQAQAQLLRQMNMDLNIIPSDDGSERSRTNSTGTAGDDCGSPDVEIVLSGEFDSKDNRTLHAVDNLTPKVPTDISQQQQQLKKTNLAANTDTPLDALFQLSTKKFDEEQDPATLNIFSTRSNPKKKRKSRTAFTNHQIFELEKRFLYQKYLSPADRDEIAAGLGLSNAQVITWFQNRRAKLKRDMEELKKDVESVKQLSGHKSFLENVNDLSILKTRPVSRQQQQPPSTRVRLPYPTTSSSHALDTSHPIPADIVGVNDDINTEHQTQQQQPQQRG